LPASVRFYQYQDSNKTYDGMPDDQLDGNSVPALQIGRPRALSRCIIHKTKAHYFVFATGQADNIPTPT
jgi:hypothetical protein